MNDWVIAVDLGGTKTDIGLVDPHDRIIHRARIPTQPHLGPDHIVGRIAEETRKLASGVPQGERIAALGICSPGPVDFDAGVLVDPPNLSGLHFSPIRQMLSDALDMPVVLEHDAKATCLGEFYFGAGQHVQTMAYIIIGTGVGAGVVLNGQLLRGPNNSAGEVGHIPFDRQGDLCSCGSRGCVETFLSGPWLVRRYLRKLNSSVVDPAASVLSTSDIIGRALKGDVLAREIIAEAGDALGAAVATLAMVLDVDFYVVGGSVVKSGELLLEPARRSAPSHCYRSVGCNIRLVATDLGDDAALLGCARLARDAASNTPRDQKLRSSSRTRRKPVPSDQAALESVVGMVANIQRFSVHDGPGIRTNVFLKGCPLRCAWCSNPETHHFQREMSLRASFCMRCGQFDPACPDAWSHGALTFEENRAFNQRSSRCPAGALRWVGERLTAKAVIDEVLRDRPFYDSQGGLTLTGGEPTLQPDFSEALLRLARSAGLTTVMETSGHTRWNVLRRLLPYLDLILFDIKHVDNAAHRRHTGVGNDLILANLHYLAKTDCNVQVRVPLIPGFNADIESVTAIGRLVAALPGISRTISLLPYHTFGKAKYQSLGRDYPWAAYKDMDNEHARMIAIEVEKLGLQVRMGY